MTKLPAITPQETFSLFILGGGLEYAWYANYTMPDFNEKWEVYADWEILADVYTDIDESDNTCAYPINHHTIMKAVHKIAKGNRQDVSKACERECKSLIFSGDADIDSDIADQVLQVATLGSCIYG